MTKELLIYVLRSLCRDEAGQDLVEYALLTGLIAACAAAAFPAIASTSQFYSQAMSALSAAVSATASGMY